MKMMNILQLFENIWYIQQNNLDNFLEYTPKFTIIASIVDSLIVKSFWVENENAWKSES